MAAQNKAIQILGIAPEFLKAVTSPLSSSTTTSSQLITPRPVPPLPPSLPGVPPLRPSHLVTDVTGTASFKLSLNSIGFSGDVVNGIPSGFGTLTLADGTRYKGGFSDGKLVGKGVYDFPDGSHYEGDVLNGLRHGSGTFVYAGGVARYEGEWKFGKRSGEGILYYGPLDKDGKSLSYYRGSWSDDARNGAGLLRYKSGNFYAGNWRDDKKEGLGRFVWTDLGEEYCGEWSLDQPHGEGVHTWYSALAYGTLLPKSISKEANDIIAASAVSREVDAIELLKHANNAAKARSHGNHHHDHHTSASDSGEEGVSPLDALASAAAAASLSLGVEGVLQDQSWTSETESPFFGYPASSRYRGSFVQSYRNGFGTFYYSNSSRYTGEWVNDKKQGHGVWCAQDGSVFEGLFWDDQPVMSSTVSGQDPTTVTLQQAETRMRAASASITQASVVNPPISNAVTLAVTASLPNPNVALQAKLSSLLRPLSSEPLFALHIVDLLPTDETLLSWYKQQHPNMTSAEVDSDAPVQCLKMRAQAVQMVENVMLRWNSKLTGWYSSYAKLARAGTLAGILYGSETPEVNSSDNSNVSRIPPFGAFANSNSTVGGGFLQERRAPTHAQIVDDKSAESILSHLKFLSSSQDNCSTGPQQPTMRLHQLWRLCVDTGATFPPEVTLSSIDDMLFNIRARQSRAVIDSAGRLAALASKLFSEQKRVQQEEAAAAAAAIAAAANAKANKSGRFQSTRKQSGTAEGKVGEEKKGEDNDGENNMLVGGSSILSEGNEDLLSLPIEAALAVEKITRFEVAQLQDAYHYRHDPDTPVQFREFAEVLVRLASARSRANANAAMTAAAVASAHAQAVLEAVQQRHAERAQSITTARSLSPTTPGRNKFSSASTITGVDLNSTVGGLSSRGGGPGTPSTSSQKQLATMTYGRIRKEGPSLISDNSHYAISHAPSSLARLNTSVDLPTAVANAALAAAAASAAAAAALGGGGPESLAYVVDLFFWERMNPYALYRQPPVTSKGHHHVTATPAVQTRSSGYGRTVTMKDTTSSSSSSSERAASTPLSSLDPLRSVCHASNVSPSLVLVSLATAKAAKNLHKAEIELIEARHSRHGVQHAEEVYAEASKHATLLPPSSVLENPALEHTLNAQWGRQLSEIFQSICNSRSAVAPVPAVATAALAVLSLSVPVSVNDNDSVFPTLLNGIAPSPSYGSCTIADVMSAFSNCQDLLESRPSSIPDNEVMMYMGRLVSSGSLDRVSVGDKFRFKSAANSALASQKQVQAAAAAAPPAGAKPAAAATPASPSKGSKAGSVVAAPVEPVVSEATAQKQKEEAEARSEQIRLFIAKCSAPTALRTFITEALENTPFFGPAALLRSLYMAVRHASSPADAQSIFSLSTKPVPEPSSNEPMISIPVAARSNAQRTRNSAQDRDDETVVTSASGAQASYFEAEAAGQSSQPSFSVPATIIVDPSTNQTALSIDLLGLSMVKCEFFEGILRCSAALTASVVSRKAHSQSIQQALPGKALELLKIAEEEAAAFFAPPEGCDPSVAEALEDAKVAALAEIESDLDFVLRKGTSQIRYAATVGPFEPPKLTAEEQMLEESSDKLNRSRLSTASAELFEEGSDPRQAPKGVTFDATVPDTSAAEGGNEGSEAPEPPVKLEKEAYVPPMDPESPASLAAAGMPVVVNKLISGFTSGSGGGGHTVSMHFEIFEEI